MGDIPARLDGRWRRRLRRPRRLTASGDYCIPRPSIANVETLEAGGPILYLYRRVLPNTAGAGRQRGGATIGVAITPHETEELHGLLIGHGVELRNDEVDAAASRTARLDARTDRLGRPPERDPADPATWAPKLALGPSLRLDHDGMTRCRCGHKLAAPSGNWKEGARTSVVDARKHGPHVRLHEELELREHICPACALLLESEVARVGAPDLYTVEVRL